MKSRGTRIVIALLALLGSLVVLAQPASAETTCSAAKIRVDSTGVFSGTGAPFVNITTSADAGSGVTSPRYTDIIVRVKVPERGTYEIESLTGTDSRGSGIGSAMSPPPVYKVETDLTASPFYVHGTSMKKVIICLAYVVS